MPLYKVWRMTRVSVGESTLIEAATPELALATARWTWTDLYTLTGVSDVEGEEVPHA